ncbi:MAG: hypothetical protein ACLTBX_04395 [Clostridia bacterium]
MIQPICLNEQKKLRTNFGINIEYINFDAPYNRKNEFEDIVRAYSWYDVYQKMKGDKK